MLLKANECKKGMRVKLKCPDPQYSIGKPNPAVGTKYECAGTIDVVGLDRIGVLWDSGRHNSYKDGELIKVENPNGNMESIW
jgi:hypothetical protein